MDKKVFEMAIVAILLSLLGVLILNSAFKNNVKSCVEAGNSIEWCQAELSK